MRKPNFRAHTKSWYEKTFSFSILFAQRDCSTCKLSVKRTFKSISSIQAFSSFCLTLKEKSRLVIYFIIRSLKINESFESADKQKNPHEEIEQSSRDAEQEQGTNIQEDSNLGKRDKPATTQIDEENNDKKKTEKKTRRAKYSNPITMELDGENFHDWTKLVQERYKSITIEYAEGRPPVEIQTSELFRMIMKIN